ncbi:MAG: hypothetical protein JXM69_19245 [Anaerolineae bacterium]|nr:hypothetical protein [Anaerolineae bacterium]
MTLNSEESSLSNQAAVTQADSQARGVRPQTRYLMAAAVSLIVPVVLIYTYTARIFIVYDILLFISAIYLFYTFKSMILTRFNFGRIKFSGNLLIYSLITYFSIYLSRFFLNHNPLDIDFATATFVDRAFYYAAIAGLFAISIGATSVCFELQDFPDRLYRLYYPLRFMLMLVGLVLFMTTLGLFTVYLATDRLMITLSMLLAIAGELLLLVTYSLTCGLFSLIFLFTAFRNPSQPVQS